MMDRRTFLVMPCGGLLASLVAPRAALGQTARKVARIGLLFFDIEVSRMTGPDAPGTGPKVFLREMRELGYVYGRDFVTEPRGGDTNRESWPGQAAELVQLGVDVMLCAGQQMAV